MKKTGIGSLRCHIHTNETKKWKNIVVVVVGDVVVGVVDVVIVGGVCWSSLTRSRSIS